MIDPTGNDKTLREPGTKELIKLTKNALDKKLNSNDANINGDTITIKGQSVTPITEIPAATDSTLGGVIVGDNINVDENGVISIDDPPEPYELPIASDTELGGIKVGNNLTIDSETGVLSADDQSITVDDELDDESENPVQNKVLTPVLESLSTMITKISKQKVDLWWGMDDAPYIVTGSAFRYLDGFIDDSIPIIDNAEIVTE